MPHCFVLNCKNRTGYTFSKNVRYYSFPRNPKLRSEWLTACQKDENRKITHERICEIHFSSDCFEHKMTKPRSTHVASKVAYKLKIGSVPTEFLDLPSKRQKLLHFSEKRNDQEAGSLKKSICSGIPTYSELVGSTESNFEENTTLQSIDDMESTTITER
ncbi:hypothetical protein ALC62_15353 [Cyphomyrmex costatus]|uniref:THAP-type domain-containing protein n=1 Tax=Cyphomyrmex costatus TaxID=456900 RepID=A0A151I7B1_9HYME|nr:hypothetical protein ALC62_15353 [Cyphomyrmex costatus]